ncbi:hypothetical protein KPATCC21470_0306 [Kitasatospora purpeofusca]
MLPSDPRPPRRRGRAAALPSVHPRARLSDHARRSPPGHAPRRLLVGRRWPPAFGREVPPPHGLPPRRRRCTHAWGYLPAEGWGRRPLVRRDPKDAP